MIKETSNTVKIQEPQLLSNTGEKKVFNFLEREMNNCNEYFMSVAFITKSGITPFLQTLKEQEDRNIPARILTTDYLLFSDPEALDKLNNLKNVELRMYETQKKGNKGFHTKGYVFRYGDKSNVIVGSSNLTHSAIFSNYEWNVLCNAGTDSDYLHDITSEFNLLWNDATLYNDCKERYKSSYEAGEKLRQNFRQNIKDLDLSQLPEIKPNDMQKAFIFNLNKLLDEGENRALLVSATGTGKTYASALAVKDLICKKWKRKILFVSHREQINKQALESYTNIFGKDFKMELLSGNNHCIDEAKKSDFLFSTVQTMSKDYVLNDFSKDEFSIIILDECHRVGAESYQKIIDYFTPKLLLGMSASPERTDGIDIFKLFNYNIAYEIRLQQALEHQLLCPFHYFGITDLFVNDEEHDCCDFNLLTSDKRIDYILSKIKYYGHSGYVTKGLVFCSTKKEAASLSQKFNCRGFRSVALTGDNTQEDRLKAIKCLENEDPICHIDYIFTVDIFNEGVDIPQVNQVILLRPTQSPIIFVQQIGRGLRKYKNKEYVVILDFIGNYNNNYMIPVALSGDRSGNKDNMRRCLLEPNELLNGASTIHFDAISRKRIYASIDTAKLNTLKTLKEGYRYLKMKLGCIPALMDFDLYGEIDPMRIVQYSGSYHQFLIDIKEPDYSIKLNGIQTEMVNFISSKLMSGHRFQELLLLELLINNKSKNTIDLWKKKVKDEYGIIIDQFMLRTVIRVLQTSFYAVGTAKKQFGKFSFVTNEGNISTEFNKELKSSTVFKNMLLEIINFGLHRNAQNFNNAGTFVRYKKYTYEDVCRLLNWESNEVALNIGGYKFDEETNTFPVYINYQKSDDISESINYEDRFVDNKTLLAISKGGRTMASADMQSIKNSMQNGTQMLLFLRKNKDDKESKEFYYLGKIYPTGVFKPFVMKSKKDAVEIEYKLENPVPDSLYDYFITD